MRRVFSKKEVVLLVLFFALLTSIAFFYALQFEPRYYRDAMDVSRSVSVRHSKQFALRLSELQNQLHLQDEWAIAFSENEINGWLSQKYATVTPTTSEPRISIEEDNIAIGFQFKSRWFKFVITLRGDLFCTEQKQIAAQIDSLKIGMIPVPIGRWANQITDACRKAGMEIDWAESEGKPVALIGIGRNVENGDLYSFNSIQLLENEIRIAGSTLHGEE